MKIKSLKNEFSICKLHELQQPNISSEFYFIGRTDEELSLVCVTQDVPDNVMARDDGWRAFRVEGILNFSLVGVLAEISSILAQNSISLFALSTFNTDYILVRSPHFERALAALQNAGHEVV